MKRRAIVATQKGGTVSRYLPSNYEVVGETGAPDHFTIIEGEDNAGWTLDGYVIPRLASGLFACREVPLVVLCPKCRTALESADQEHPCVEEDEPSCFRCGRKASEIDGLEVEAKIEEVSVQEYARQDGTYNRKTNHFACNKCYIEIGMPSSPTGWKAP